MSTKPTLPSPLRTFRGRSWLLVFATIAITLSATGQRVVSAEYLGTRPGDAYIAHRTTAIHYGPTIGFGVSPVDSVTYYFVRDFDGDTVVTDRAQLERSSTTHTFRSLEFPLIDPNLDPWTDVITAPAADPMNGTDSLVRITSELDGPFRRAYHRTFANGRLTRVQYFDYRRGDMNFSIAYEYDNAGRVVREITTPDARRPGETNTLDLMYNSAGQLTGSTGLNFVNEVLYPTTGVTLSNATQTIASFTRSTRTRYVARDGELDSLRSEQFVADNSVGFDAIARSDDGANASFRRYDVKLLRDAGNVIREYFYGDGAVAVQELPALDAQLRFAETLSQGLPVQLVTNSTEPVLLTLQNASGRVVNQVRLRSGEQLEWPTVPAGYYVISLSRPGYSTVSVRVVATR